MGTMLDEAQKIIDGKIESPDSDDELQYSVECYHNIWTLVETLETCVKGGWDVSNHLKQITTGTVDYGKPMKGNEHRKIFYKDFECELFIGSVLIKNNLYPELLPDPDDPKGDIKLNSIYIEIKHPNSTKQITKLMRKFNKEMRDNGTYGVFVVGVEDMFNMGDVFSFPDQIAFDTWNNQKRKKMEQFAKDVILPSAKNLPRIIGLVQTSTHVYEIAGASGLKRLGNSMICLRRNVSNEILNEAEVIAKVFNPNPPKLQC